MIEYKQLQPEHTEQCRLLIEELCSDVAWRGVCLGASRWLLSVSVFGTFFVCSLTVAACCFGWCPVVFCKGLVNLRLCGWLILIGGFGDIPGKLPLFVGVG